MSYLVAKEKSPVSRSHKTKVSQDRIADFVLYPFDVLDVNICAPSRSNEPYGSRILTECNQIKKARQADLLYLVYPTGFEPTTFGSASQRSIQLSYGYIFVANMFTTGVILSWNGWNY